MKHPLAWLFILAFSLFFSTLTSTCAQAQAQDEQEAFAEIEQLFQAREFEKAKARLIRMELNRPLSVSKYMWLSRVQLELGAGIAAETAIERARELGADFAVTAVPYAKAMLVQGKYESALDAMRGVSIAAAMQGQAYIVSGDANFALGNYQTARRDYELAIDADNESFQPYLGLARLALREDNLEKAQQFAEEAGVRGADNTMVQYTLGLISRYTGRLAAAEAHFLDAVNLFPNNIMANIELASIRINQNNLTDAETYLDTVYSASANQPMAIYLSAVILATRADYEAAELLLLRVPQLTENYLPAVYVRGMVAYQLGKNEEAVASLEKVLSVRPSNKAARMALAGTYANQQRPRAALRILQPLLQSEKTVDTAVLSMAAAASIAAGEIERGRLLYGRVAEAQGTGQAPSVSDVEAKLAMAQFVSGSRDDAVATISAVSAGVGAEVRELGIMASMQMRNDDLEGARVTIDRLIETAPNRALGYNMKGTLSFKEGRFNDAVVSYSQALDRNAEYYSALRNRGLANFRLGEFADAETDLKRLLRQQPNDARSKAVLGKTLLTVGKAEEAVTYFKEAIREIDSSVHLAADYAQALADAGNTTRAIEQARDTAKKGSERPDILRRMGVLLLDLGQAAAAERPLSRHAAFAPQSGQAHLLHGRALLSMGLFTGSKMSFLRAENAIEEKINSAIIDWYLFAADALARKQEAALEKLDQLDFSLRPADVAANVVGDLLLSSGLVERAEKAYRDVYDIEKSGGVAIGLSRALTAQGKTGEAVEIMEEFVVANPSDRFVRAELAIKYEESADYESAAAQYRTILNNGVADAVTAAKLALVYKQLNNTQSIRLAEQAYLISPENPFILDVHGWILLQADKDTERAITSLEKAVRRSPANATYKYHLGMAYLAQNRRRDAKRLLVQALNLQADFEGADEARRQVALLNGVRN